MAAKKKVAKTNGRRGPKVRGSGQLGVPAGFRKVENRMVGFWKPEIVGQSVHGVVGERIETRGPDGQPNVYFKLTLKSDHGGPIKDSEGKTVKIEPGNVVGVSGKMLWSFLLANEGQQVFIAYDGLGEKRAGKNAAKLFTTWVYDGEDA